MAASGSLISCFGEIWLEQALNKANEQSDNAKGRDLNVIVVVINFQVLVCMIRVNGQNMQKIKKNFD